MFDAAEDDSLDLSLGETDSLRQQVSALRIYLAELLAENHELRVRLLCAECRTGFLQSPDEDLQT